MNGDSTKLMAISLAIKLQHPVYRNIYKKDKYFTRREQLTGL